MRINFARRTAGLFAALVLASCFGDSTGPGSIHRATLSFAPSLDREAALLVPFDSVRITLRRPADNSIALDTTIFFPANVDTVSLDVQVAIQGATESFTLDMDLIDATGAVVFHAGPIVVTAKSSGPPDPPPAVPFIYVGVGSNATGVRFVGTQPSMVFIGDTALFVAEAVDASNNVVLGTPIRYGSSDTVKAKVPSLEQGRVAGRARGTASISASLLPTAAAPTPPSVNGSLLVQGKPATVVIQTGNGQTGGAGSALTQPVVARVNANDGLGVQGIVVNFAVTSGGGSVSPLVDTTDVNGDVSTAWTLGGSLGPQAMTATAVAPNLAPATVSFGATAVAGSATRLAFTTQPATVGAGLPITPAVVVVAQDAFGNTATTFSGQIAIAIGNNPGGASLSGTTTVIAASGVATFSNLILSAPSPGYTLLASATGLTAATSGSFTVQSLNPTHMTLAVQPSNTTAGAAITPAIQVELRDAANNIVTSSNATVTIAIGTNPAGGTLSGTASVAAVNGVATFSTLSIDQAGTGYTLAAGSTGLPTLATAAFDITPAAPAQLAIGTQPSNATAGTAIAPAITVQIRDGFGNLVTSATGNVTLAILNNPSGGTLSGTATVAASGGVATFNTLSMNKVGSGYTLQATSGALTAANTAAFDIGAAAPAQLVFTTQPPSGVAQNAPFGVAVAAQDAFGNAAAAFTGNVTVAIGANPGGSTLGGTTTLAATAGVATFTSLTLNNLGTGYTLTAAATGLAGATSATFDVGFAASINQWNNPAGGNWSVAANWSLGRVPQTTDSVVIDLPGSYAVTLDTTFSASFLVIGGATGTQTLSLSSRTLTVGGVMTVRSSAVFASTNSTVSGAGSVVNQGTVNVQNSTISSALTNQGTVVVGGTLALTGALSTVAGSTLRVQGGLLGTNATVTVASGFSNAGALELTTVGGAFSTTLTVTNGTLTNAVGATITSAVGTGGPRTLDAQLDNQGTLNVLQALTLNRASSVHSNSGTIDLGNNNLTLTQSGTAPGFTNTGAVTIGTSRTWTVTGGTLDLSAGTVSGAGVLNVSGGTILSFSPTTVTTVLTLTAVSIPAGISVASGQTLTLLGGSIADPISNQGTVVVGGTLALNGALSTAVGSTLRVQGGLLSTSAAVTVASGFSNAGALELTTVGGAFSTTLTVTNGTLTNAVGATITSAVGTGGPRTLDAQLDNQGTLNVLQALTLNRASSVHSNSGTIDLGNNNLTLTQSGTAPGFTNTGAVTIGTSRTWTVTGGTLDLSAGTVSGAGVLNVSGGTILSFSPTTVTTVLTLTAVSIPAGISVASGQTLTLLGGSIADPISNQGTVVVGGTLALNGALSTAVGSTLRVQGGLLSTSAAVTVASGFSNAGALELTTVGGAFSTTLTVTNGTLTNAVGATITSAVGTGGPRTLDAQLDNQGTVTVLQALTLNRASSVHSNSGTIDLGNNNLTLTQSGTAPGFTNTGAVTIGTSRTWTVTGGTLDLSAGTVSGAGVLNVSGGTILSFSPTTVTTVLTLTAVSIPAGISVASGQTLTLLGGSIADPISNQGTVVVGGTLALNGALSTAVGSTLRVQGGLLSTSAAVTVASGFSNAGALELTTVGGAFSTTLTVTNGTLTNAVGATITSAVGTGGPRTLDAQLDNQGTVTVLQALTLNRASSVHSNSGTIDLGNNNLTLTQSGTAPGFTNTGAVTIGTSRTWTVTGGTLDLSAGTVSGAGVLNVSGGTILSFSPTTVTTVLTLTAVSIPAGISVASGQTLTLLGGSIADPISNQGTVVVGGTLALNGALSTAVGSTLRVQGGLLSTSAAVTVANGFSNAGALELTTVGGAFSTTLTVTNGTLTNAVGATITSAVGTGGPRTLDAQLDNQGTVTVLQALTLNRASSVHSNSGTIDLGNNNLTLTQSGTAPGFTNTGAVTIGTSQTWTVTGGTLDLSAGTVSGAGVLNVSGGTVLSFSPTTVGTVLTLTAVSIPAGISVASGQTLTLLGGSIADPISNQGTVVVGGTLALTGALTTAVGSTLRVQGGLLSTSAAVTVANGFTNNAAIELTTVGGAFSTTLTVTNGTLTNAVGATITSAVGTGGPRTLDAQLDNQGALNVLQPLTLNRASSVHSNSGTIDLGNNNLTLTQSGTAPGFTNTGAVTIGTSQTWTVTGGTLDLSAGTVSGAGVLNVSGGTILSFSPTTVTTVLTLTAVSIPAGISVASGQTLTLLGGSIADPISNQGTVVVGGTLALTGALTTAVGSTLRVQGGLLSTSAAVTVASGFSNAGALELTTVGGAFSTTLTVTNGTLTNAVGATITSAVGTGGPRTLAAQLDNQGTVTVLQPLTLNRASSVHSNSGTITVSGGNLTLTQTGTTPSFTNVGTIDIGGGRTFTVTGGVLTNFDSPTVGLVRGTGTLNVAGSLFTNNGNVNPAGTSAAGILTLTGNYSQGGASSALNIELGGATPASPFDQIPISGTASLGGTLNVTPLGGTPSGTFVIMTYTGTASGNFTTINLLGAASVCSASPIAAQYRIVCP